MAVGKKKRKPSPIGAGPFEFASVGLAAASGLLPIDAFAACLDAMRPRKPRKRNRGKKA